MLSIQKTIRAKTRPNQTQWTNIQCLSIIIAMSFVCVLIRTNTKNANTNMNEALPEWWQIASKQNSLDDWTNALPTGLALKVAKPWNHVFYFLSQISVQIQIHNLCTNTNTQFVYKYKYTISVQIQIHNKCANTNTQYAYKYTICVWIQIHRFS